MFLLPHKGYWEKAKQSCAPTCQDTVEVSRSHEDLKGLQHGWEDYGAVVFGCCSGYICGTWRVGWMLYFT